MMPWRASCCSYRNWCPSAVSVASFRIPRTRRLGGSRSRSRCLVSIRAPIPSLTLSSSSSSTCLEFTSDEAEEDSRGEGDVITTARRRSTELVEMEYAQLNLKDKLGTLGHVRIRQHVNPLNSSLSVPAQVPDWKEVFMDPTLPLMVDIGSGSGRFLLWLAKNCSDSRNYLGLEIRKKLVKRADFWAKEMALGNIHFMFANATISFEPLVAAYPGPLMLVSILCPDPYFKKRHHKRRVLQKPLLDSISKNLAPGGKVFVQSDVYELGADMRHQFDALTDVYEHVIDGVDPNILCDSEGWVLSNPMGIRTEREIHAELEGAKIYRRLYQKLPQHGPG